MSRPTRRARPQEVAYVQGANTREADLISQFGQMSVQQPVGAAPSAIPPQYGAQSVPYMAPQGQAPGPAQSYGNQLFPMDLKQHPFTVTDLDLPPPPVVLPPFALQSTFLNADSPNLPPLKYMRSTLNAVPSTDSLLKKSHLPFSLVIQPYASLHDAEDDVPVVSDQTIARCRRCRSYINPFVSFVDAGAQGPSRWRCNLCGFTNDIPQQFTWNADLQKPISLSERTELQNCVVEYSASQDYMIRPPQRLIYLFLIDVSAASVDSGLLATTAQTILRSLDRIPNVQRRACVGFICVDSSLNIFSIPPDTSENPDPELLVVPDLDEPFIPTKSDIVVNLADCRANIERFLGRIQTMFQDTRNKSSAMGSALRTAHAILSPTGGKITVVTASLPNMGYAALTARQGSEKALLQPANKWYRQHAVECCKVQISVDLFLCSAQYQDVATLSNLPRYTSGQTYYYPAFNAMKREYAEKFSRELGNYLSSEIAFEAVLRVRASSGLRMNAFYGNFFNRSSDLCAFPAYPRDQAAVVEVAMDDDIPKDSLVSIQAAVLHTTCNGERRIRVITLCLPSTSDMSTIYASADQQAIATYFSHRAVDRAFDSGPENARDFIQGKIVEIIKAYRKELSGGSTFSMPVNLRALPTLFLALTKTPGLSSSTQISPDARAASLCLLSTLPIPLLMQYIYPRMYSLHDMPDDAGTTPPDSRFTILPPALNLSVNNMVPYGLYLIDNGQTQILWLGRDAVDPLLIDVFGTDDRSVIRQGMTTMMPTENDFNARVREVIEGSRDHSALSVGSIVFPTFYLVWQDGDRNLLAMAQSFLVESQLYQQMDSDNWLELIREKVLKAEKTVW